MSDLLILHRTLNEQKNSLENIPVNSAAIMLWETCRRQIFFSDAEAFQELQELQKKIGGEIIQGLKAEQFILEILCGLHSALLAETEVFGQFREWIQKKLQEQHGLAKRLESRIQLWFSEVKKIRETYLCGTGSQSYGSLLRKGIPPGKSVAFIGAGQLVQECLPWLDGRNPLQVWVRSTEKYSELSLQAELKQLTMIDPHGVDCLIIAAPLSGLELKEILKAFSEASLSHVFDLRRDSMYLQDEDLKKKALSWNHLDQLISQFESQQEELLGRVSEAHKAIELWREQQQARVQVRPFGWDDLWS